MKSPQTLHPLQQLRSLLARLSARERRILLIGSILLALTLLWLLYDWQSRSRQQLDVALPRTEAQLARMQTEAAELARLRNLPAPPISDLPQLLGSVQSSATARGFALLVRSDGNQLIAQGKGIAFDSFIPWLADTQRNNGLRVVYLDVSQGSGGVTVEVRLMPAA